MDKATTNALDYLRCKIKALSREVCDLQDSAGGVETDPIFSASPAFGIASSDINNWNDSAGLAHEHFNKTTLDGITVAKVNNWDSAYTATQSLSTTYVPIAGATTITGAKTFSANITATNIVPDGDATRNLGSQTARWQLFVSTLLKGSNTNGMNFAGATGSDVFLRFQPTTHNAVFQNAGAGIAETGYRVNIDGTSTTNGAFLVTNGISRFAGNISQATTFSHLFYNTVDETTNYERGYLRWNTNVFEIGSEIGGTGTNRQVRLAAGSTTLALTISNTSPRYLFGGTSGSNDQHIVATNGTFSSGGTVYYHSFSAYPTLGNSGTSTYTAYYASPLSGGTSTGEKKLIDVGTNSSNTGALSTHTSRFKVLFDGTTTLVGNMGITGNLTMSGQILPDGDNTRTLGSSTLRMSTVYAIHVSKGNAGNSFNLAVTNTTDIYMRVQATTNNFVFQQAGTAPAETGYKVTIDGTGAANGALLVSTGISTFAGNISPNGNGTLDLGTTSLKWNNLYTNAVRGNGTLRLTAGTANSIIFSQTADTNTIGQFFGTTGNLALQAPAALPTDDTIHRLQVYGKVKITDAPTYADNAAALSGGLIVGSVYKLSDGSLKIVI